MIDCNAKFDLHSHSTFSDGELTPTELLLAAKESGISHLALTDHDTVDGLDEAHQAAQEQQLTLISGVELSATWRGQLLHILGLGIDPSDTTLSAGIASNKQRRQTRAIDMINDFRNHGIELESAVSDIIGSATPTRPHFAQALINLGHAKSKNQAFKRFLVRGKPGYIALQWPSIAEIADWIHAAGGIAVLAHPLRYKFTRSKLITLIDEMADCGIRALEVSTPTCDPQQRSMLERLCIDKQLAASMGSDFHAHGQPWARLGTAAPLSAAVTPVWQLIQSH